MTKKKDDKLEFLRELTDLMNKYNSIEFIEMVGLLEFMKHQYLTQDPKEE